MSEHLPQWREENGDVLPVEDISGIAYQHEEFDPTEYSMIPDAAFRAAERLISEDTPKEEAEKVKPAGPAERLMRTLDQLRFAPREKRELSDTYDLIGTDLPGGAATHLNNVLKHQDKYNVETPSDGVQSIVRRYATYAENAQKEGIFLNLLQKSVDDAHPHRFAAATSLSAVSVWSQELSVSRPLLHILQSRDVDAYIHDPEHSPNPLDVSYTMSDRSTVARLDAMLKSMRASELTGELKQAISEEKHRYDFWVKALQESCNHTVARGQAHRALVELGAIEAE